MPPDEEDSPVEDAPDREDRLDIPLSVCPWPEEMGSPDAISNPAATLMPRDKAVGVPKLVRAG
jgi:hypothetical protein